MIVALVFGAIYGVVAVGRLPGLRVDRTAAAVAGVLNHLVRALNARIAHPAALLVALVGTAGLLSAIFVNDTICVAFTPVVLELARARQRRALPYLLALTTAATIGSVATIVGNPQNMLIETVSRIGFFSSAAALGPIALVGLAIDLLRPVGTATAGGLAVTAAVLSNLVSNVPALMLFTPLVPDLPQPGHAWLTPAMASTLAGNLTVMGSIANLIVVESARRHGEHVRVGDHLKLGVPITALTLAFGVWWLAASRGSRPDLSTRGTSSVDGDRATES